MFNHIPNSEERIMERELVDTLIAIQNKIEQTNVCQATFNATILTKLDSIHEQTTKTNGTIKEHTSELVELTGYKNKVIGFTWIAGVSAFAYGVYNAVIAILNKTN